MWQSFICASFLSSCQICRYIIELLTKNDTIISILWNRSIIISELIATLPWTHQKKRETHFTRELCAYFWQLNVNPSILHRKKETEENNNNENDSNTVIFHASKSHWNIINAYPFLSTYLVVFGMGVLIWLYSLKASIHRCCCYVLFVFLFLLLPCI